jgi:hypothetical protein
MLRTRQCKLARGIGRFSKALPAPTAQTLGQPGRNARSVPGEVETARVGIFAVAKCRTRPHAAACDVHVRPKWGDLTAGRAARLTLSPRGQAGALFLGHLFSLPSTAEIADGWLDFVKVRAGWWLSPRPGKSHRHAALTLHALAFCRFPAAVERPDSLPS